MLTTSPDGSPSLAAEPPPASDFHLEPGGIITGVVVDMATGLPLANVNVNSGLMDGDGGIGRCSEADGSFTLQGLVYGDYAVSAGGGWNHCQEQPSEFVEKYWDGVYLWDDATPVNINDPAPVPGINLEMEPGGYITGNVSNTGGLPVEGLRVAAVIPSPDCPWCHQWMADTDTDANGDYVLGPLPPLDFAVYACASCNGQLLVEEYYDDVWRIQNATLLPVTTGATVPGIDFVLDPGVLITGTVTVPGGYSAEDLQVDVWEESHDGYGTGGRTDAAGYYQVPVPPIYDSDWSVAVRPWGTDLGSQWAHGFDLFRHTSWDFDLGPGATIAGTITSGGVPVQDAYVNADSPWMGDGAQTDASGNYEITNLPPGEYEVYAGRWPDYMENYYGGHNRDWDTPVWLEEGEFQGGVDISITPLGRLYGTVYESDGTTPIEGVRVVAMNEKWLLGGLDRGRRQLLPGRACRRFSGAVHAGALVLPSHDLLWRLPQLCHSRYRHGPALLPGRDSDYAQHDPGDAGDAGRHGPGFGHGRSGGRHHGGGGECAMQAWTGASPGGASAPTSRASTTSRISGPGRITSGPPVLAAGTTMVW